MSRRSNAILTVLFVLGLAAVGLYVASRLEQVDEDVPIGLQGAARENPLLAAERFLDRMGVHAEGLETLGRMPPRHGALLLAEPTRSLTTREIRALTTWIAAGGHLIVSATRDGVDPLLFALDVEVVRPPRDEEAEEAARTSVVSIPFSDPAERLEARMRTDLRLRSSGRSGTAAGGGKEPAAVLEFPMMSGTVSALSDLEFIRNGDIGDHDHARVLFRLVGEGGVPDGVWLVRGGASPSLAGLLWSRFPRLLISLAALILAWVWTRSRRFGPLLAAPTPGSRSLLQHVEAIGLFLWRRGGHAVLIESARSELQREIARRRPHLAGMSHAERSTALASESGLPRKDILPALAAPCPRDPERFTQTIRTLETLRRHL